MINKDHYRKDICIVKKGIEIVWHHTVCLMVDVVWPSFGVCHSLLLATFEKKSVFILFLLQKFILCAKELILFGFSHPQ